MHFISYSLEVWRLFSKFVSQFLNIKSFNYNFQNLSMAKTYQGNSKRKNKKSKSAKRNTIKRQSHKQPQRRRTKSLLNKVGSNKEKVVPHEKETSPKMVPKASLHSQDDNNVCGANDNENLVKSCFTKLKNVFSPNSVSSDEKKNSSQDEHGVRQSGSIDPARLKSPTPEFTKCKTPTRCCASPSPVNIRNELTNPGAREFKTKIKQSRETHALNVVSAAIDYGLLNNIIDKRGKYFKIMYKNKSCNCGKNLDGRCTTCGQVYSKTKNESLKISRSRSNSSSSN